MTVTRKQRDSDENSLALRNEEHLATPERLLASLPKWAQIVHQMAQDKRHDLEEGTIRFWKEKLKSYREETVCRALMTGRWQFFPSVDDVIAQIEAIQEQARYDNGFAKSCGKCEDGWVYVTEPRPGVVRCECRK